MDWGTTGKELLAFAIWWAERYQWRSGTTQILPHGNTPEDVVQQVIVKTIEGTRNWDPDKGPLAPWLKDQIRSEIDALAKSASHRHEMTFPEGDDGEELQDKIRRPPAKEGMFGSAQSQSPEAIILEQEKTLQAEEKVRAAFHAVDGEPELEAVLEAIMAGCEPKPRYLAEELGVPVKDIYNRMKRLRRRALAIRSPQ